MTPVPATADRPEAPLFTDGLGERIVAVDAATSDLLQILRVRPQLLAVPSFEFALRERAARLANFRHAYYARVRRIDRHPSGLAIVSDHVEGVRLSDMLRVAEERGLRLDLNAALCLLRQLAPSLALLHENARDVAHGLLAPERLIVTPRARLVVVEHVLGSAVEQLQFTRERLWQDLRVAVPVSAGPARFDHRADVTAMGLVALALVLGRPLRGDEYPQRVSSLLNEARARSAGGGEQPLPAALRNWIARALQVEIRQGFASATEAQVALEEALSEDSEFVAAPVALETFLSHYIAALLEPPMPVPAPAAAAPEPLIARPPGARFAPPVVPAAPRAPSAAVASPPPVVAAPPLAPPPPVEAVTKPKPPAPEPFTAPEKPYAEREKAHPPVNTAPAPAPRDITELLRDFDIPSPVPEAVPPPLPAPRTTTPFFAGWRRIAALVVAVAALGEGGLIAARKYRRPPAAPTGSVSVQTNPQGVAVFIDGVAHGNTPARITLPAGSHIIELRGRGVPRVIPITVTAGAEASQYLELPETPSVGSLIVQSDPAGAHVTIDGVDQGKAPASIANLTPGEHEVVLQGDGGPAVHQRVVIQAGVTSSVLAPVATAAPGPVSGWLVVKAPFAIEIHENGRMIGSTGADRIMMASGRHDIELVNDTLGYQAKRVVQVIPGKVASLNIDLPQGVININASPWAEVWIDGRRAGETPIGNLPLTIGPHEVVFRHPQLGEKKQAVSVTLSAPVRLSMDMR